MLLLAACGAPSPDPVLSDSRPIVSFPKTLDSKCKGGRAKIYDECGSQPDIFRAALDEANRSGKTLIVSYGAEWCIWCHVFASHLRGGIRKFTYPVDGRPTELIERANRDVDGDARSLNEFAASKLIIVHIEGDNAPDGLRVLEAADVDTSTVDGYPYIMSVTSSGKFAARFDHDRAEVRREGTADWYRGYDRAKLLAELQRLRSVALRQAQPQ